MQLNRRIVASLAAATGALLGASSGLSIADEAENKWNFDTALAYYGESDRVTDASFQGLARRTLSRGMIKFRFAVDSLTGSSANGAVPANGVQTFTSPSGKSSYTTGVGQTPLDPTFLDTRIAASVDWDRELGERSSMTLGASFSNEYDYLHAGITARYGRQFNERNTTLSFGLGLAGDSVDPVGGAPIGLSMMLPVGDTSNKLGDDSKTVTDLLVGVTQVFGRRTIGQFNYSVSRSSGYLTDPYKMLSVVDPVTGDPVAGPGGLFEYRFEQRPEDRTKHSLFGQIRHQLGNQILDGSYRFMTDDWGVQSHTLDLRWRRPVGQWYLQPHVRYYTQTAADFFSPYLLDGDPLPDEASADYRLGELDGLTVGLKVGRPFGDDKEWSMRVEYYEQSARPPPGSKLGSLAQYDLNPAIDAVIAQFGYRF